MNNIITVYERRFLNINFQIQLRRDISIYKARIKKLYINTYIIIQTQAMKLLSLFRTCRTVHKGTSRSIKFWF